MYDKIKYRLASLVSIVRADHDCNELNSGFDIFDAIPPNTVVSLQLLCISMFSYLYRCKLPSLQIGTFKLIRKTFVAFKRIFLKYVVLDDVVGVVYHVTTFNWDQYNYSYMEKRRKYSISITRFLIVHSGEHSCSWPCSLIPPSAGLITSFPLRG